MNPDPTEQLRRIERKLNVLTVICGAQAVVLALLVVSQYFAKTIQILLWLTLFGFLIYMFRRQIPGWFGVASRFVFAQLASAEKSHSSKDL